MGWAKSMPDEAFKALIIGGAVLALVGAALLALRAKSERRLAHAVVCTGGALLGVGLLIEMLREESKLSHGAIAVFAAGVLATALSYVVWLISSRHALGIATAALLVATALSAAAVGVSFDAEECGCGNPADVVTTG